MPSYANKLQKLEIQKMELILLIKCDNVLSYFFETLKVYCC